MVGIPEDNGQKLRLIINVRFLVLCLFSMLAIPALKLHWIIFENLWFYSVVLLFLFLTNLLAIGAHRKLNEVSHGFLCLQLVIDVVSLGLILKRAGGAWNPLLHMLTLYVVFAGLLLPVHFLLVYVLVYLILLGFLHTFPEIPISLYMWPTPSGILFPSQILITLLAGFLTWWVSAGLAEARQRKQALLEKTLKFDKLRAFGIVANGFSHEFSTPLNTARLRLDRLGRKLSLQDNPDFGAVAQALDSSERALKRLVAAQIRDVHPETVDMGVLLQQIVAAHPEGLRLEVRIGEGVGRPVLDLPRLAFVQGFLGTIDNALLAEPNAQVAIELEWNAREIQLKVLDAGPGFPPEILDRWGEPFNAHRPGGSGLGIYQAVQVAESLGGSCTVQKTSSGGGAVLWTLPKGSGRGA